LERIWGDLEKKNGSQNPSGGEKDCQKQRENQGKRPFSKEEKSLVEKCFIG